MSNEFKTINKTWFKNRFRKGLFMYKQDYKYTDDYAWDYANDYGQDKEFTDCAEEGTQEYFDDWYIKCLRITGDKNGYFDVTFAGSTSYTFILKEVLEKKLEEELNEVLK